MRISAFLQSLQMLARHPALKISLVFAAFFLIVVALSMAFGYQTWGGFIAPLVLLAVTAWLYKHEGKSLARLGLTDKNYVLLFFIGLLLGVIFYAGGMYLVMLYKGLQISYNANADYSVIATGVLFFIAGVMNEELIFRGYCFEQTVNRYGTVAANMIFAFLFLVWHWFAWDAWGNYGLMISAITVCFGHFLFATAFLKSGTLLLPVGIHLGNNWAVKHFAVYQPAEGPVNTGSIFLVTGSAESSVTTEALTITISVVWMLVFTLLIWKFTRDRAHGRMR